MSTRQLYFAGRSAMSENVYNAVHPRRPAARGDDALAIEREYRALEVGNVALKRGEQLAGGGIPHSRGPVTRHSTVAPPDHSL